MPNSVKTPVLWPGEWWTITFEGETLVVLILNAHRSIGTSRGLEVWLPTHCKVTVVEPRDFLAKQGDVEIPTVSA